MYYKRILRWIATGALCFLSFVGVASLGSHYTDPTITLSSNEIGVAWVFGVGGVIALMALFFINRRGKGR